MDEAWTCLDGCLLAGTKGAIVGFYPRLGDYKISNPLGYWHKTRAQSLKTSRTGPKLQLKPILFRILIVCEKCFDKK